MAKAPKKKYQRAIGSGIAVETKFFNRLLAQVFDYTWEALDNQLATLITWKGAGDDLAKLGALLNEQQAALEKSIAQLDALCQQHGVRPVQSGAGFARSNFTLSRQANQYFEILKLIDQAVTRLQALWIAGRVDDEAWKAQTAKLRSRAHDTARAVSEIFDRHVKRQGQEEAEEQEKGTQDAETQEAEAVAENDETTPVSAEADAPETSEDAPVEATSESEPEPEPKAAQETEDTPATPDEDSEPEPEQEEQETDAKDVAEPIDGAERKPGGFRGLFGASAA